MIIVCSWRGQDPRSWQGEHGQHTVAVMTDGALGAGIGPADTLAAAARMTVMLRPVSHGTGGQVRTAPVFWRRFRLPVLSELRGCDDGGSLPGCRADLKRPADDLHPLAHSYQSQVDLVGL